MPGSQREIVHSRCAAIRLRDKLGLQRTGFEIVTVATGVVRFTMAGASAVALAPYCPACADRIQSHQIATKTAYSPMPAGPPPDARNRINLR